LCLDLARLAPPVSEEMMMIEEEKEEEEVPSNPFFCLKRSVPLIDRLLPQRKMADKDVGCCFSIIAPCL
jgi:hypothetical protein